MAASSNSRMVLHQLPDGPINVIQQDDIIHARGIHYARFQRFEPPQTIEPWSDVIDCIKPGPVCPQLPSRLSIVIGDVLEQREVKEDCLYLSVTAPAKTKEALPVMVWLHGGAYISGGGDLEPYDATTLVEKGVVVVNVSYRLGIFGQIGIPDIAPANLGLQDQITALHWIQRNISSFGGDADNVTLFGQSAGADSIYCIMAADGTEDLYHRVIIQSAPWGRRKPGVTAEVQTVLPKLARQALNNKAQDVSVDELLSLQARLLEKSSKLPNGKLLSFLPQFGASPLPPESDIDERIRRVAKQKPLLIGWVQHETLPFALGHPVAQKLQRIPLLGSCLFDLIVWYTSRTEFISGAKTFHAKYLEDGGASTSYSWDYRVRGNNLKASHCIDLPFIFGNWAYWSKAPVLQGIEKTDFVRVSENTQSIWVAFAKGAKFRESLTLMH